MRGNGRTRTHFSYPAKSRLLVMEAVEKITNQAACFSAETTEAIKADSIARGLIEMGTLLALRALSFHLDPAIHTQLQFFRWFRRGCGHLTHAGYLLVVPTLICAEVLLLPRIKYVFE